MISGEQVVDTLRLLIPGFVALKVFYWFGLRTKRADWEWTLWAVLISSPIALAATAIAELLNSKPVDLVKTIADCDFAKAPGKSGDDLQAVYSTCASEALLAQNTDLRLGIALVLAVVGGFVAVWAWTQLVGLFPRLRKAASLAAWDAVLRQPHWVQIKVDDFIYYGRVDVAADPNETDALDIYIKEPALIRGDEKIALNQTVGILIARDKIDWIQVLS